MAEKNSRRNQTTDALFDAILSLETREECYNFFEDLCTVKEISDMPQRLEAVKNQLENLYQQQAAAKEGVGKPFPFEDDLRVKSARLVELDTLLNIDGKGHAQPETVVAKSARPSVLDSLKRPVPPRSPEKKPKQHEEVR